MRVELENKMRNLTIGLWIISFAYTLLLGLAIQLVVLPSFFPQFHEGHGLLANYDYSFFHRIAVDASERIAAEGWSAWRLAPLGRVVPGIASAFYALITPEPWTVLPFNAALHATSVVVLFLIFRLIVHSEQTSLLAAIPFLVFPTALQWTAQMHNDSYAVLGVLLYLYGWVALSENRTWSTISGFTLAALSILVGVGFLWLVRPFMVEVLLPFGIGFFFLITAVHVRRTVFAGLVQRSSLIGLAVVGFAIMVIVLVAAEGARQPEVHLKLTNSGNTEAFRETDDLSAMTPEEFVHAWNESALLPQFIDARLQSLSLERRLGSRTFRTGASNIDIEVQFRSASELVGYLPRAAEIGLLAPFPEMWFDEGSKASSAMMRRVAGLEMVVVYLVMLALPYAVWRWRRSIGLWMTLAYCIGILLVYTIATPNVGTLVRFRYPFFMTIVGLGVTGWVALSHRVGIQWRVRTPTRS